MSEIWYASGGRRYKENEPCFFNAEEYPWATAIEKRWNELKEEVHDFIEDNDKNFVSNAYTGVADKGGWSSLSFLFWGFRQKHRLKEKCPKLAACFSPVPGIVSLSFSRLAPHTTLKEHRGDTNAVFRCHLGIEIPASLPHCGLKVGNEERAWEEGKWLFFNDAWTHSAWNNTAQRRIVLIIDVIRPDFLPEKRLICANILARHVLFHYKEKYKIVRILPRFLKGILFAMIFIPLYVTGAKAIL